MSVNWRARSDGFAIWCAVQDDLLAERGLPTLTQVFAEAERRWAERVRYEPVTTPCAPCVAAEQSRST
jgi:hypothetical protein